MAQDYTHYTYLQMEIKKDDYNNAVLTLTGRSDLVSMVQTYFGKLPDSVTIGSSEELASVKQIMVKSESTDYYSAYMLKMAVLDSLSYKFHFQVVPTSIFVDLAKGTEKLMLYTSTPGSDAK